MFEIIKWIRQLQVVEKELSKRGWRRDAIAAEIKEAKTNKKKTAQKNTTTNQQ